ncbi:hypothetical protein, partial [Bradyrhizobium ottawaense]|uniref:hypothetical protein n=1 Tax=Bradyrhizobium ottawaense TaxID=931866 RepID=UPI0030C663DC
MASVVIRSAATEAAFWIAVRAARQRLAPTLDPDAAIPTAGVVGEPVLERDARHRPVVEDEL